MDTKIYLENIHRNLQTSIDGLVSRWSKIFLEYQLKLQDEGPQKAEEYLALRMGELGFEFQSYYVYFADFLQKNGLTEASEIMKKMGERFLKLYRDYEVRRAGDIVRNAEKVSEELAKNFRGAKNSK